MNLKVNAERFEQRMKVEIIIKHIIKTLLKSKIIYSFELTGTNQIFGFEKMLLFLSGNVLVFLPMGNINFRKM